MTFNLAEEITPLFSMYGVSTNNVVHFGALSWKDGWPQMAQENIETERKLILQGEDAEGLVRGKYMEELYPLRKRKVTYAKVDTVPGLDSHNASTRKAAKKRMEINEYIANQTLARENVTDPKGITNVAIRLDGEGKKQHARAMSTTVPENFQVFYQGLSGYMTENKTKYPIGNMYFRPNEKAEHTRLTKEPIKMVKVERKQEIKAKAIKRATAVGNLKIKKAPRTNARVSRETLRKMAEQIFLPFIKKFDESEELGVNNDLGNKFVVSIFKHS